MMSAERKDNAASKGSFSIHHSSFIIHRLLLHG